MLKFYNKFFIIYPSYPSSTFYDYKTLVFTSSGDYSIRFVKALSVYFVNTDQNIWNVSLNNNIISSGDCGSWADLTNNRNRLMNNDFGLSDFKDYTIEIRKGERLIVTQSLKPFDYGWGYPHSGVGLYFLFYMCYE